MKDFFFRAIFAVILGFGLLSSQASVAADKHVSMKYSGTGIDTAFDTNNDGQKVSLTQANGRGTFGNSAIAITAEFRPPISGETVNCLSGELGLVLFSSEHVVTFADQSQLFGISSNGDGWLCVNLSTGWYHGQVEGNYVGGTGRFEDASGTFTSRFDGQNLGNPLVGFRSITGTIEGTVSRP